MAASEGYVRAVVANFLCFIEVTSFILLFLHLYLLVKVSEFVFLSVRESLNASSYGLHLFSNFPVGKYIAE